MTQQVIINPPMKDGIAIIDDDAETTPKAKEAWEQVSRAEITAYLQKHHKDPKNRKYQRWAKRRIIEEKKRQMLPRGKNVTFSNASQPFQVVYGSTRIGGCITMAHQTGDYKEKLNLIVTLAGHQITAVDKLWIDKNIEITFPSVGDTTLANGPVVGNRNFANKIRLDRNANGLGGNSHWVSSIAKTEFGGLWTDDCWQEGCAKVFLQIIYDALTWPNTTPEIHFDVRGKPIWDPRLGDNGEYTLTDNAALVLADFLTDPVFGKYSWAQLDQTSLIAAANICDEQVEFKDGGYEKRYCINGAFNLSENYDQIVNEMALAMAGKVVPFNGRLKFIAGKYTAPVSITLEDDDLRSEVKLSLLRTREDKFNAIKGRYISRWNFEEEDIPPIKVNAYVTEDNGKIKWKEQNLPFTQSSSMAQRILRIELEKNRRDLTISASWSLKAYPLSIGDTVTVNLTRYGFTSKTFEVLDWDFAVTDDGEIVIDLELQETDEHIDDWDPSEDEQTVNQAPNTTLPYPTAGAPSALVLESGTSHLDVRADGTIFSRIYVAWTLPYDIFIQSGGFFDIQYKKNADADWRDWGSVPGNVSHAYILDVKDGVSYDVRIRSRNAIGLYSAWVSQTNYTVVGKTEPPSNISSVAYQLKENGLLIHWAGVTDIDLREYEIRTDQNWGNATNLITRIRATGYLWARPIAGTYNIYAKAIDTSGNYSATAATVAISVVAPGAVQKLVANTTNNNVMVDWELPIVGTLPIDHYKVYKGATFETANLVGRYPGTFMMLLEKSAGTFTYWIEPCDIAGNSGAVSSIAVTVKLPMDYVIREATPAAFGLSTSSNVAIDGMSPDDMSDEILANLPGGITPTYWMNGARASKITIDSARRIAAITDFAGGAVSITQATDASKPVLSSNDELENRLIYSERFDVSAAWSDSSNNVVTANQTTAPDGTITADKYAQNAAGSNYLAQLNRFYNTGFYEYSIYAKAGSVSWLKMDNNHGVGEGQAWFDLTNGVTGQINANRTASIEAVGNGWYRCTIRNVTAVSTPVANGWVRFAASSTNNASNAGAGGYVYLWGAQLTQSNSTYVRTDGFPHYPGKNGMQKLTLDGAGDHLVSSVTLANLFTPGAKTLFLAICPTQLGRNQRIFRNNGGGQFSVFIDTNNTLNVYNNDGGGGYDYVYTNQTLITGRTYIIAVRHGGGNLKVRIDGLDFAPVASGNTSDLSAVVHIGGNAGIAGEDYVGSLLECVTFNSELSDAQIAVWESYLTKKWVTDHRRFIDDSHSESIYLPVRPNESWRQHFENAYNDASAPGYANIRLWLDGRRGVVTDSMRGVAKAASRITTLPSAWQGVSANRPVLSRADNQENLVLDSEISDRATYWAGGTRARFPGDTVVKGGATLTFFGEDGTAGNTHIMAPTAAYQTMIITSGQVYTVRFVAYSTNRRVQLRAINGFAGGYTIFDLVNGTVAATAAEGANASMTPFGGGAYLCSVDLTANATVANSYLNFYLDNGSTRIYNGDNASGIYIGAIQARSSLADSTYIATVGCSWYRGVNGNTAPVFDGNNDYYSLPSLAVNPTGGMWGFVAVKQSLIGGVHTWIAADVAGANKRLQFLSESGGIYCRVFSNTADYIGRSAPIGTVVAGEVAVFGFTYDGGTSSSGVKIFKNGLQVDNANSQAGSFILKTEGTTLTVGAIGGANALNGSLGEAIFAQGGTLDAAGIAYWSNRLSYDWRGVGTPPAANRVLTPTRRGFSTAGYTKRMQPTTTAAAYIEWTVDIGTVVGQGFLDFAYSQANRVGAPIITPTMSVSVDGVSYTDYANFRQLFATNFRYVKLRLDTQSASDLVYTNIFGATLNIRLGADEEEGVVTCPSTDVSGTAVTFQKRYLDIVSIKLQPVNAGSGANPDLIFNFAQASPSGFAIKVYDKDGARMTADINYRAKGVVDLAA